MFRFILRFAINYPALFIGMRIITRFNDIDFTDPWVILPVGSVLLFTLLANITLNFFALVKSSPVNKHLRIPATIFKIVLVTLGIILSAPTIIPALGPKLTTGIIFSVMIGTVIIIILGLGLLLAKIFRKDTNI